MFLFVCTISCTVYVKTQMSKIKTNGQEGEQCIDVYNVDHSELSVF